MNTLPENYSQLTVIPESSVWLANQTSDHTQATYQKAVGDFLGLHNIVSQDQLQGITQAHVIVWRERMKAEGMKSRTIANRLSALSSLFNHLCEKQLVRYNPVTGTKRPKVNQATVETVALSLQQARKLLDAPDTSKLIGLRDRAILHVLLYTGCRVGAISKLLVGDIFEDSGYMVIELKEKGDKVHRVPVNQELQIALRLYLAESGHDRDMKAPLFLNAQRKYSQRAITPRTTQRRVKKYALELGFSERITPHSTRATFATELFAQGVPAHIIQKDLNHTNISTTMSYNKSEISYKDRGTLKACY